MSEQDGTTPEETQEQRNQRIAQKCADLSDALAQELLSVIGKHRKVIEDDKELNPSIMFQIMQESISGIAAPIILTCADYTKRVAELQGLPDIGESSYLLAAQADFVNGAFERVSGMVQRRALAKTQKSPIIGV